MKTVNGTVSLIIIAFLMAVSMIPDTVMAASSGDIGEFTSAFEKIVDLVIGKFGQIISTLAVACLGIYFMYARQEMSEGFKIMISVALGISFVVFAANLVNSLFNWSGAVI